VLFYKHEIVGYQQEIVDVNLPITPITPSDSVFWGNHLISAFGPFALALADT
jgi:hypothetical protein